MTGFFQDKGLMSLNSIVDSGNSSLRSQGWLKVEAVGLHEMT